jgi:antitoxin component YwqK of YwqJK toxin-antitoxin module
LKRLKKFISIKHIITHLKTLKGGYDGELNGKYIEWFDNGKKWVEGQYTNNKREGLWDIYNYSNTSIESGKYIDGNKEGKWITKWNLYSL